MPALGLQNDSGTSLQSFIVMTNAPGNKGFALSLDEAGTNANTFSINDEAAVAKTRFLIDPNGNVGIGTSTPSATLHVVAPVTSFNIGGSPVKTFFNFGNTTALGHQAAPTTGSGSIVAEGNIWCEATILSMNGTITGSDARLKNIIGRSDSRKDLERLNHLEVTDFTYIDTVTAGHRIHKKLVAQQAEQVMPEAIAKRTDFLTDIYTVATKVEPKAGTYIITVPKPHDLKTGDKVRLVFENDNEGFRGDVKVLNDTQFQIAYAKPITTTVFVYGKLHDDVRGIDYDDVAMLNVSATQELAKRDVALEKRVAALEAENARLKAQAHKLAALESDMETLKQLIPVFHNKKSTTSQTLALAH